MSDLVTTTTSKDALAIIAEKMSVHFADLAQDAEAMEMGEAELFGFMADYFAEAAEQVATTAQSLHENVEMDAENVRESFAAYLEDTLDAVDLYEAMEAESEDEDEDMEDEDEDEDEDMEDEDEGK